MRLERTLQPGADQRGDACPDRRLEHRAQQLLDLGGRDLALDLELAIDEGGEVRRRAVDFALRVEQRLPPRVAHVGLARGAGGRGGARQGRVVLDRRDGDGAGLRRPVERGVVDHGGRNRLPHDGVHRRGDDALAIEPVGVRIGGLQLVAQVPVADQAQLRPEQAPPVAREQVMRPQVVTVDVGLGGGPRIGEPRLRRGRHAQRDTAGEARLRPLPPAPLRALAQPLGQRAAGEVEQHDERDPCREQIVGDVARRIPGAEPRVDRQLRTDRQIEATAEIAAQRVEIAVDALEGGFEPCEGGVQRRPLRQELGFDQGAQGGRIAVVGAPRALHLGEAARDSAALPFAVPRHQRRGGGGHGVAVRVGVRGHRPAPAATSPVSATICTSLRSTSPPFASRPGVAGTRGSW